MTAIIQASKLWKEYGDTVVLEDVNVSVDEGEFVTIVGASGCGKTTLLKMLLGTEVPSRGELLFEGAALQHEPSVDRGIVFQRYSVFPHKTVLQNVMMGDEFAQSKWLGRTFGKQREKHQKAAMEMLDAVGLSGAIAKYPHELSGGMQQRLAIAQALIKRPKILLLDEPFGALDPGIRADMHVLTKQLWQEHHLTIFMITHDIKEGFQLGSRLWVFDKVRHDPHEPNRFGAKITYDLPLNNPKQVDSKNLRAEVISSINATTKELANV